MKTLIDKPTNAKDLFEKITRKPNDGYPPAGYYFITQSRRTEPELFLNGVTVQARFEDKAFMCSYVKPSQLLLDTLGFMADEVGSFQFTRWPDGTLNLLVRPKSFLGSHRVCIIEEPPGLAEEVQHVR